MAYLPLSTANLPDPVIDPAQGSSPEDYFNTVTYTGNGSTKVINDVGLQADFIWIKQRNGSYHHALYDVLRGFTSSDNLASDDTAAEGYWGGSGSNITSINSSGYTLGDGADINSNNDTFVAWNWKANGSGVSNTDGSITSSVSANTESGFSIVSYTGNGSTSGETYGHGLDQSPEMIITKARETNSLNNWPTWHKSLNANSLVYLNSTTGQVVETGWMPTLPSDTLVYLGTGNTSRELTNNSDVDYIAYCFHSVEGFSKFGTYIGNGSTDGPFVYTGFRPAFVITKKTSGTSNWQLLDAARTPINDGGRELLRPNTSDAEISDGNEVDFLSNGFKQRSSDGSVNQSGGTYIYMAFAENPFKYSNAR